MKKTIFTCVFVLALAMSVQTTLVTAVLVGMAQEQQFLSIDDPVSKYIGAGWSPV
jgi:CubicO group peptidase (beta-lactamase class C family)